jgi:hypothetical protein
MIVGRAATSNGRFHIVGQVRGTMTRIGRYHKNADGARTEAAKLKRQLGLLYVQVVNPYNGWFQTI